MNEEMIVIAPWVFEYITEEKGGKLYRYGFHPMWGVGRSGKYRGKHVVIGWMLWSYSESEKCERGKWHCTKEWVDNMLGGWCRKQKKELPQVSPQIWNKLFKQTRKMIELPPYPHRD